MADDVQTTIARVAGEEGIDPAYALATASRESSFNSTAHASKTIYGLFQMNAGERKKYGAGDSNDPEQQTRAFAGYTRDLQAEMTGELGRPPTNSELYLGHYWGGARAARVISGSQAGLAPQDMFTPQELAENPDLAKGKSAGELASTIMADIGQRQQQYGGGPSTNATASGTAQPPMNPMDFAGYGRSSVEAEASTPTQTTPDLSVYGKQQEAPQEAQAAPAMPSYGEEINLAQFGLTPPGYLPHAGIPTGAKPVAAPANTSVAAAAPIVQNPTSFSQFGTPQPQEAEQQGT